MESNVLRHFKGKKTLVSQRIDIVKSYNEIRDALDQRLISIIDDLGGIPIIMPNILKKPLDYLECISPDIIVLSGGNDIVIDNKGDDLSEIVRKRDTTESVLLAYAVKNKIPVLGICRGMQMINVYFGGKLIQNLRESFNDHVAVRHDIKLEPHFFNELQVSSYEVNSYHNQGFTHKYLSENLLPIAVSKDGIVEAVRHKTLPIIGIQWHPEREEDLKSIDIFILKKLLTKD